jgi:DNA-binding XRE family transcriptional regulator
MDTGDRVKMLRIADGLTQQYLAELLGVSQNTVAKMESGKSKLSLRSINILSNYFIVSKEWLQHGTPPVILNGWGYACVPFKGWKELPSSEKPKKLNQIVDAMGTIFIEFLAEGRVKKFFKAQVEGSDDAIFVLPLSAKSSFVLRCAGDLLPMMEGVFKDTGLKKGKSIVIPEEMARFINQSSSPLSRLEHTIELHRMLGLKKLTQAWSDLKHPYDLRSARVYQNRINKVCRDILAKGLDPADVISTLKEMTGARLNYQFKDSVDFLLSRSKSPLFKSRYEKFRNGDNSDE